MNDYEKDFYKIMRTIKGVEYAPSTNYYAHLDVLRMLIKNYELKYCGEDFKLCCEILWYNYYFRERI